MKDFKKNWQKFEEFERKLDYSTPVSYEHNRRIYEALYQQARKLNLFPAADPLEGIETDIKVAKILNAIRRIN